MPIGRAGFPTLKVTVCALLIGAASAIPAAAFEPAADEKDKLKACEQSLCSILLKKETTGADLSCDIGKTWTRSNIKDGVEKKKISWTFGDARCGVNVEMSRAGIVAALTQPESTLAMSEHTLKCEVERETEITPINVTLAPKLQFKNGKAEKAWLNVSKIDAPSIIKAGIWTVAKAEDTFGLFHGEMIEEINEFIHEKCAKRYPQ